ncbi:MAG TPA: 1,4-dihydroxy-2-naphthoate octaprenyltransferase [Marinilabiliales bacterium]|nr:MAG: 1,4-dihydroxy-2-naphthoate octaprenyltransferase [Bacteroidetes bacterium GWA2_40_14]OFX63307.1 MAG: 1,4-dihydroxy-2-naphthoate octaprenyltransferase [Bacteroidetes bacterium GWC2_40_13]OFX74615.1 MAG: 1,4-dihydroxy-2-naphthoate octaprenyltransferase [Bacteroidetes bacterium GWD2_40_43]OFX88961.1 MAG: 1,4-dihydroxy-2-naphthoate octaprenyltransferase [Bacteroidetes bacterium GWE2_40_63]OFY22767.1 MAG: 1,4-dihydroxy-2-naphthoate octaprenyltransferase [Bacteroidetes bacterium GWF2_40_13]O
MKKQKTNAWIRAVRLRTLPLSISGVIMGSALALGKGNFHLSVFLLALLTTLLLQILSNLANDYGDYSHGTDNENRVGPQRTVQSGAIKPNEMRWAMAFVGILSFISGILLLKTSFKESLNLEFLIFLIMGLLAISAAIKYTVGKNPFGYQGFGDLMVFVFFGIVAVLGTYFLHAQVTDVWVLLPAISIGALSVGVLNINNMRDIVNDKYSGKNTIPVRLGSKNSKYYHLFLMLVSFISLEIYFVHEQELMLALSLWIPFSLIGWHSYHVIKNSEPKDLDPELKRLSLATLLIACWCGLGLFF